MQYNVPTQTLRDRVNGKVDLKKVTMGPAPLPGQEEEAMLLSHLKAMASFGYGYTRKEVTNMASDYAIQLRKRTKQQKPLTLKWFRGFMNKHVCALTCQAYSKALSAQHLQSVFRKCGIYPLRTSLFLRKNSLVSVKRSPHMLFEIAHPLFL
eukprot:XP_019928536.1 PREDICTED: uncharacterized protein LOC105342315 [Crassostrea gigas]